MSRTESADQLAEMVPHILEMLGLPPDAAPVLLMPLPKAPSEGAPVVYLDTNHWVALAQARTGHSSGARVRSCYEALRELTATGDVQVVLSAASYMELALAVNGPRRRTDLADVMSEISRFWALRRRSQLVGPQMEVALHNRLGRPMFPDKPRVVNRGAMWALDGRVSFPQLDNTPEEIEGFVTQLGADTLARLLWLNSETMEYGLLRGVAPSEVARVAGYNLDPVRLVEEERTRRDLDLEQRLAADPSLKGRLEDILWARELYWELGAELPATLAKANLSIDSFFWKGKDWIADLLKDMPSLAVDRALRRQTLKNGSRPWSTNDQRDLDHLSISVPYCDIVVTEKHAVDALKRAGLDSRLNTKLLTDLSELEEIIGS